MAKKGTDVELVISAKNQASKDIDELVESLEALSKEAGGKLTGMFEKLTSSTQDFAEKQTVLTDALTKAKAAQAALNKANQAREGDLAAYQDQIDKTRLKLDKLNRQYEEYTSAVDLPRKPSEALIRTFENQQSRLQQLGDTIASTSNQLKKVQADLQANTGVDAQANANIDAQRQKVIDLGAAWRQTQQLVAAAQKTLQERTVKADTTSTVADDAKRKLEGLRAELNAEKQIIQARKEAVKGQKQATEEQIEAQKASVASIQRLRKEISAQIEIEREARLAKSKDASAVRQQTKETDTLIAQAGRQKQAYTELKASLASYEQEQRRASTDRQTANIDSLNAKLAKLRTQYEATGQKVAETNAKLATASAVNPATLIRFEALKVKIAETEQAIREQTEALDRQQQEYAQSGAAADGFADKQARLDAVTEQLTAEQRRLNTEAQKAGVSIGKAGKAAATTGKQFKVWGEDSRQALSYLQRIRGELLSIAAAYVGVFAVGGAIRSIYDSSVLTQKATSRLSTVFSGDMGAVADEMAYVERTADRLGLEYDNLVDQYSAFATAVPKGRLTLEQLRFTFEGVATAAVATGASTEDVQGTFRALTQIVSKGQLQLEELTGQLAERIPGALQATVDGLNDLGKEVITVETLLKRINAGEVSGDVIVAIAQGLTKQFGPALTKALDSPVVALNRFRNELSRIRREITGGGFIEELVGGLNEVTEAMKTPEFRNGLKDLAAGMVAAMKFGILLVQNMEALVAVLKVVVAIKAASVFMGMSASLLAVNRAALVAAGGIGTFRTAMIAMTSVVVKALRGLANFTLAAFTGFEIGTYLNKNFIEVRKFGVKMVEVFEVMRVRVVQVFELMGVAITNGLSDVFKGLVRMIVTLLPNALADVLEGVGKAISLVNKQLGDSIQQAAQAISGREGSAIDTMLDNLLNKFGPAEGESLKLFQTINDEAEKELNGITEITKQMIVDIEKEFAEANISPVNAGQLAEDVKASLDEIKEGLEFYKAGSNAGKSFSEGLIDQLKKIEQTLQSESADTLEKRLVLIRQEFEEFLKGVSEFQASSSEAVTRLREGSEKKIAAIQKQAGLDESARALQIAGIRIATENEIATIRKQQNALRGAAGVVEQLVAIRTEKERQAESDKQTQLAEQKINDLIAERKDHVAALTERRRLGLIDEETYQSRLNALNETMIAQIRTAVEEARKLAAATGNVSLQKFVDSFDDFEPMERARQQLEALAALEAAINAEMQLRKDRLETINVLRETGVKSAAEAEAMVTAELERSTPLLRQMMTDAIAMAVALGDEGLVAKLTRMRAELEGTQKLLFSNEQLAADFASGFTNAFDSFIRGTQSASEAFKSFIADFLRNIALAIIQAVVLKAVTDSITGGAGGGLAGVLNGIVAPVQHTGGIVGSAGVKRLVNPALFANAIRYHSGGIAGIKPNEIPTILERGEEVLPRSDPRHAGNGGGAPQNISITNAIDSASVIEAGVATSAGQKSIINFIRANKAQVKAVLA